MDYSVNIVGSVAQVILEQHYANPMDVPLELEYVFPIEPASCVASFKAIFDDHEVVGVVREKQVARE